jgi:hypothetical protein
VKLLSGDPTWRDLTALQYHFETQPLPTFFAWYAHRLPQGLLKGLTVAMFACELGVPFLFFAGHRARLIAFVAEIGLQVGILLTGNYTYFNWLTVALCLTLLDDGHFRREADGPPVPRESKWVRATAGLFFLLGAIELFQLGGFRSLDFLLTPAERLRVVSGYGLFAVMTTERDELVIEGSRDGTSWSEYEFPWKPGDVKRAPGFVAPHQPRLDWQMWFAALGAFEDQAWLQGLLRRLLEGEPRVLALLATNPFGDTPPKFVRVQRYRYHFSDAATKRATGAWWTRELVGEYAPAASLRH